MLKAVRAAIEKTGCPSLLYGSDLSEDCIGKYFVDRFWKSPLLSEMPPSDLVDYCKHEGISVIFPSRDGELPYFAKVREYFMENGISIMVSELSSINNCFDKFLFYEKLSNKGISVIPTSLHAEHGWKDWVVKERYGAGSANIGLGLDREQAIQHAANMSAPIFQPMIRGDEYSVDVYVVADGSIKGALVRRRNKIVQGESQITSTETYPLLEQLCIEAAQFLKLRGHVIFQAFVDKDGHAHLIECNCRFGGASTLSIAMGLDSFFWFIIESMGGSLSPFPFQRSTKEKKMIRYPEDLIL